MRNSTPWHIGALALMLTASHAAADEDAGAASCGRVEFEPPYPRPVPANFEGVLVRRDDALVASEIEVVAIDGAVSTPVAFTLETIGPNEWRVRPDVALEAGTELRIFVPACSGAGPEDRYGLRLDITAEAPLPIDLGTIEADSVVRLHDGRALLALRYMPSAEATPWRNAWWGAIQVDGESVDGPHALERFIDSDGLYPQWLHVACSPGASGIAPGAHTLRFAGGPHGGGIGGTSNDLAFQADCPPIPPPPDPDACIDAGIGPDGMHHSACPEDAGPPRTCPGWPDAGEEPPVDEEGRPICGDTGDVEDSGAAGAMCSASRGRGAAIAIFLAAPVAIAIARRRLRAR